MKKFAIYFRRRRVWRKCSWLSLCGFFLYRNLKPDVRRPSAPTSKMLSCSPACRLPLIETVTNSSALPPAKNREPLENVSCDASSINHVTPAFSPSRQESPDFVDLHHFEISECQANDVPTRWLCEIEVHYPEQEHSQLPFTASYKQST